MNRVAMCWMLALGISSASWSQGADPPAAGNNAKLMKEKLAVSQELLPALAKEDFAQLKKSADKLSKLAKQQWIENETPEYQAQLKDFWVVVEGIGTSAKEKNLDEATLGYVQMTISCVKCHKSLRKNAE